MKINIENLKKLDLAKNVDISEFTEDYNYIPLQYCEYLVLQDNIRTVILNNLKDSNYDSKEYICIEIIDYQTYVFNLLKKYIKSPDQFLKELFENFGRNTLDYIHSFHSSDLKDVVLAVEDFLNTVEWKDEVFVAYKNWAKPILKAYMVFDYQSYNNISIDRNVNVMIDPIYKTQNAYYSNPNSFDNLHNTMSLIELKLKELFASKDKEKLALFSQGKDSNILINEFKESDKFWEDTLTFNFKSLRECYGQIYINGVGLKNTKLKIEMITKLHYSCNNEAKRIIINDGKIDNSNKGIYIYNNLAYGHYITVKTENYITIHSEDFISPIISLNLNNYTHSSNPFNLLKYHLKFENFSPLSDDNFKTLTACLTRTSDYDEEFKNSIHNLTDESISKILQERYINLNPYYYITINKDFDNFFNGSYKYSLDYVKIEKLYRICNTTLRKAFSALIKLKKKRAVSEAQKSFFESKIETNTEKLIYLLENCTRLAECIFNYKNKKGIYISKNRIYNTSLHYIDTMNSGSSNFGSLGVEGEFKLLFDDLGLPIPHKYCFRNFRRFLALSE